VRKDKHGATVDLAVAGDNTVGEELLFLHPEGVVSVGAELIELMEGAVIKEVVDPLAGGLFALVMLFGDAGFTAALAGLLAFRP